MSLTNIASSISLASSVSHPAIYHTNHASPTNLSSHPDICPASYQTVTTSAISLTSYASAISPTMPHSSHQSDNLCQYYQYHQ